MSFPAVTLDPSLLARWPRTRLGLLFCRVRVLPPREDIWTFYAREIAPDLTARLASRELSAFPPIADARAAFKAFGADPGRRRVSSEALYRRVRQGKDLYRINSLVDANNLVSLETGLSLGSYDCRALSGDVLLRLGRAGESYEGIGKGAFPLENLPLLCDDSGPFGSPVSDSPRAMISLETTEVCTVLYGFSEAPALEEALTLAGERFRRFADAELVSARISA